jgi:putative flippase GtrA
MNSIRRTFFFFLAGGTGFLVYLCLSNAMHYLFRVDEVVSALIATLLSALPTFWMQHRLTFQSHMPKRKALPRYAVLQLGNAALISGLTALGGKLGEPAFVAFPLAGITGAFISYFVQSKFIFHAS